MDIFLSVLLQVVLIILNAIFACAEIAVLQISDAKLTKLTQEGNRKAKRLAKFKEQPARFLATIQVAITLAGFMGSAFAASNFADPIVKLLKGTALDFEGLHSVVVVAITLVLSFVTLIFGACGHKRGKIESGIPESTCTC